MNARQKNKCLKKQINKLQSDNNLMHRIITDSPCMQELYDAYTKPLNITHSTMPLQEYAAKRMIPVYMAISDGIIEYAKQEVAKDLFQGIKDNITYQVDVERATAIITASIFVGRK